jgi:hypothetical protein
LDYIVQTIIIVDLCLMKWCVLKNERYCNDVMVFNIDLDITNTIIINIIIILF